MKNEWSIWKVHKTPGEHDKYEHWGGASFRNGAAIIVREMHRDGIDAVFAPPGFVPEKQWQW